MDEQLKRVIPHKGPKQCNLNLFSKWKRFLHMINKFDPAFWPPCYATIKKDIGFGYQIAFQAIKEIIVRNCETAAITTELWTSCAKSGYIGIACHWLTEKIN